MHGVATEGPGIKKTFVANVTSYLYEYYKTCTSLLSYLARLD